MYHILNGIYMSSSITNIPMFLQTQLTDTKYSNVTGGQVVEAVMYNDNVVFYSGLKKSSTVTQAVCEMLLLPP